MKLTIKFSSHSGMVNSFQYVVSKKVIPERTTSYSNNRETSQLKDPSLKILGNNQAVLKVISKGKKFTIFLEAVFLFWYCIIKVLLLNSTEKLFSSLECKIHCLLIIFCPLVLYNCRKHKVWKCSNNLF